jgi:hypothetical protein
MTCNNCDYTDTIIPIDYLPQAFNYANRKQYANWKMVGLQATHDFVGGVQLDASGRLTGIASGCRVVEEINQNNHIIGRGAWYFRGKSDGDNNGSAAYGIMGHCQSPGTPDDAIYNNKPSVYSIEGIDGWDAGYYQTISRTPMKKLWGLKQDSKFCATAGSTDWHMGAVIQEKYTDANNQEQTRYFLQYAKDADCDERCRNEQDKEKCYCLCKASNSQLPGRFTSWICTDALENRVYNTCEATLTVFDLKGWGETDQAPVCFAGIKPHVTESIYGENDTDEPPFKWTPPFTLEGVGQGVIIRLTSLPACNHFEKLFVEKTTDFADTEVGNEKKDICTNPEYEGYNPNDPMCFTKNRCERAAIRIAGSCIAGVKAGSGKRGKLIEAGMYYGVQEYHYDRWDAYDGIKIFDEIFEVSKFNYKVRVLAHSKAVWEKIFTDFNKAGANKSSFIEIEYTTGAKSSDGPNAKRGDFCKSSSGESSYFPIRPYNTYNYCPNNFTCEKT